MPPYRKFDKSDIFINRIKAYPNCEFLIYDRKIYYNKKGAISGAFVENVGHAPTGYINLYEENVDRPTGQLIYQYLQKDSTMSSYKSVSTSDFNSEFVYGDTITSSYPKIGTISVDKIEYGDERIKINALSTTLDSYKHISPHYAYNSDLGDKSTQKLSLISIPSIFYGSNIKKGSVDLSFYVGGDLIARLQDVKQNGELIQTLPYGSAYSGSVAGVCLYNEGCIILTGSWDLDAHTEVYDAGMSATTPKWYYFASTGSSGAGENIPSSSFIIKFNGVSYVNTLSMFCHAMPGEVNQSNNPTWERYGSFVDPTTSSYSYDERGDRKIINLIKSTFVGGSGSFEKAVYINKIVIFDKDKQAIAIAQLNRPVRKLETQGILFKVKIDI